MAEEVLKKLEEQLSCSICLDTYTDPKLLLCFHVYCQQCLVPLATRDQRGQLGLSCPTCRQVTPLPDRGVAGLQSAFHINHLLEIQESFHKLQTPESTPVGASASVVRTCLEHMGKELGLYCETCAMLVCWQCVSKGGQHHAHRYDELHEAFERYRTEVTSSLEPLEKQVATVKKALAMLDRRCGEISDRRAATADNIHVTFRKLREVLDARETELIAQLDQTTQGKLKCLAAQRDQIETTLAQINSCLHFTKESLRTGKEQDVLEAKANTVRRVKELTTPLQADVLMPSAEANVVFVAPAGMIAMCQNYGLVSPPKDPCRTKNTSLVESHVHSINSLQREVSSLARSSATTARSGQGERGVRYQHTISESISSQRSSAPYEMLVMPILSMDGLCGPCGVAVNQDREEVVIAEWEGHCASVFSLSGEKLRSFGTNGSNQGQFQNPRGVAVDGEGNILLADYSNNRLQKFTAVGRFLAEVGSKGSGPLQFSYPAGVGFNTSNGKVYVVDRANHRVQVLNSDLSFFSTFGKEGNGKAQFSYPCGVAFDSTGKVYVADSGNHRVQVFTAEGGFVTMFGCYEGMDDLNYPNCIAIDAGGMVYVGEGDNYRVSVFTSDGHLVTSFGRKGERPGEFNWPCGLTHDNRGVMYVCDYNNNRIQVFS